MREPDTEIARIDGWIALWRPWLGQALGRCYWSHMYTRIRCKDSPRGDSKLWQHKESLWQMAKDNLVMVRFCHYDRIEHC